ncbi:MAG: ABC transporter ATP-binding protein [Desulfobacterota bacterium]|nr:ABC transporter ATP-binding protein [Thermodesulfobacteriota bacterium]MDW8001301.1 ABC transporter ATP-binding protein [Deltaproteobacteria bacterium]
MRKKGGTILEIKDVSLSFGGVSALSDVDLHLKDGELLAIIGPNGAGKTALLNCINGFYKPWKGEIYFEGKRITKMRPDAIAKLGIARTFQNIGLYTGLTVFENIMAARHIFMSQNLLTDAIFVGWAKRDELKHMAAVEEIVDFLELSPWRNKIVGSLPYGLRKRVELGRALALEPKILLLDEPMAGMNLEEKEDIARFILEIFEGQGDSYQTQVLKNGLNSIILVEHDMGVVMDLAERIVVLDFGRKIAEGRPDDIKNDERVIRAYLGEE